MHSKFFSSTRFSPDDLFQAWMDLRQTRPHTHDQTAAELLGVPEAALHACRIGHGTLALNPDLPYVLMPISDWRRIYVINRTLFGVNIHSLRVSSMQHGPANTIRLHAPSHDIQIRTAELRYCFYVEDQTDHGRSAGIAWFDQAGDVLGKILLRSRQGLEIAKPYLLKHALTKQSRQFEPMAKPMQTVCPNSANSVQTQVETAKRLLLNPHEQKTLAMRSKGITSRYDIALFKTTESMPWIHTSAVELKCHLRLDVCVRAQLQIASTSALQQLCLTDAQGGELKIGFARLKGDDRDY